MVMSAGNRNWAAEDRTLTDLSPNVAALLCYVAGWITGIIFLVLEQKNRFIRFHALQSIIVFGTLTLAGTVLGAIPVIGFGLHWIIGITGFILWIILIVKAVNSEIFKIPWAGNLAERLTNESLGYAGRPAAQPQDENNMAAPAAILEQTTPAAGSVVRQPKAEEFRINYYSSSARNGRLAVSAFTIAWSVALLIFFNFFNQYIAYYEPVYSNGITTWQAHTVITSSFNAWLPILNTTLALSIVGHAFLLAFDKYALHQIVRIVLDIFGIATVLTLLRLFPFDFNVIPSLHVAAAINIGLSIVLIVMAVGFGIGALVKFIQLIVNAAEGKY